MIPAAGGGAGIRAGLLDLPHQDKGGEAAGLHREGDAVVRLTDVGYGLDFAAGDVVGIEAGAAPVAVVPVQVLEVEHLEGGAGVGPLGIAPVDGHVTAGLDPGVAVVGVHQIEVLDLVLAVFVRAAQEIIGLFLQHLSAVGRCIVNDAVEQQGCAVIIGQRHAGIVQGVGGIGGDDRHGGTRRCSSGGSLHRFDGGGLVFLYCADGEDALVGVDKILLPVDRRGNHLAAGAAVVDGNGILRIDVGIRGECILQDSLSRPVDILNPDLGAAGSFRSKAVVVGPIQLGQGPGIPALRVGEGHVGKFHARRSYLEDRVGQGRTSSCHHIVLAYHRVIAAVAALVDGHVGGLDGDGLGLDDGGHDCVGLHCSSGVSAQIVIGQLVIKKLEGMDVSGRIIHTAFEICAPCFASGIVFPKQTLHYP